MGIYVKKVRGGNDYYYFSAGKGADLYLAPVANKKKANIDNVLTAADYLREKRTAIFEEEEVLFSFLSVRGLNAWWKERSVGKNYTKTDLSSRDKSYRHGKKPKDS